MRKFLAGLVLMLSSANLVLAYDKEITIEGEGKCAKCALKETKECQNAIVVTEDGKATTYYLEANKVAKDYHKNVCTKTTKTKATGTVEEKDGKKILTASKIEAVK